MAKKNTALPADIELMPVSYEYTEGNKVRVTLKTRGGDLVTYTLRPSSFVQAVNMSVALINSDLSKVCREIEKEAAN
jgi:hypothetical protein